MFITPSRPSLLYTGRSLWLSAAARRAKDLSGRIARPIIRQLYIDGRQPCGLSCSAQGRIGTKVFKHLRWLATNLKGCPDGSRSDSINPYPFFAKLLGQRFNYD